MPGDERDEQDEWLRYSDLSPRERKWLKRRQKLRERHRHGHAPPVFAAIFLIAVGFLLFLNSLNILHFRNIWDFWPLVLVWIGAGRLFYDRGPAGRAIGLLFLVAGFVAFLFTLHIISWKLHDASWPFALVCLVFGFAMLIHTLERNATAQQELGSPTPQGSREHSLDDAAILSGLKRKLDTESFDGGTITNFMGNVEIDLRRAQISADTRAATVEVKSICGAVKLRVPETWRVSLQGSSVLGVFEDKTIPPNIGPNAPALVVTGYSALSAVEIEN